ncbi:hypothetical protein ACVWU4_001024 [Campylobacter coli]
MDNSVTTNNINNPITTTSTTVNTNTIPTNTVSTTETILLEVITISLSIIVTVLLILIKKLITKYKKLQQYGLTEENAKTFLLWVSTLIRNNINKKLQKEDIRVDFIEDNVSKSSVTDVSNNIKTTITTKINNIEKFNSSTPDKGDNT